MTCDEAIERLPWLLNGTLDAVERAEVQEHLSTCPACREALGETRDAWRLFDRHLPAETLVALAYGERAAGVDPGLAERHLASCPDCAAELELARMSRRLEEDDRIATFQARPRKETATAGTEYRAWRGAALAAGLAGLVAFSGWFQAAQRSQLVQAKSQEIRQEQAQLAAGVQGVQSRMAELAQPQINTPAPELHPDVQRAGGAEEIAIPAGQIATPILYADRAVASPEREIAILDAAGTAVWRKAGLRQREESPDFRYFTVTLIPGFLKPGRYTIQLSTIEDGKPVPRESYKIRVE
jgi:hypothetical protein